MDLPAHALWTNIIWRFAKQQRKTALWAAFFGILPDLIAFGFYAPYVALKSIISGEAHPNFVRVGNNYHFVQTAVPDYIQTLYNFSHSLIIFGLIFILIAILRRGRFWPVLLAWPLHILFDIPTHAKEFFPTPYLFPFDSPFLGLISWAKLPFLISNYAILVVIYVWFYWFYRKRFKQD